MLDVGQGTAVLDPDPGSPRRPVRRRPCGVRPRRATAQAGGEAPRSGGDLPSARRPLRRPGRAAGFARDRDVRRPYPDRRAISEARAAPRQRGPGPRRRQTEAPAQPLQFRRCRGPEVSRVARAPGRAGLPVPAGLSRGDVLRSTASASLSTRRRGPWSLLEGGEPWGPGRDPPSGDELNGGSLVALVDVGGDRGCCCPAMPRRTRWRSTVCRRWTCSWSGITGAGAPYRTRSWMRCIPGWRSSRWERTTRSDIRIPGTLTSAARRRARPSFARTSRVGYPCV